MPETKPEPPVPKPRLKALAHGLKCSRESGKSTYGFPESPGNCRIAGAGRSLVEEIERERGRIARELHAGAGQPLAGIKISLEPLDALFRSMPESMPEERPARRLPEFIV